MGWVSHDEARVYAARGIRGQTICIGPKADVVSARFASHPPAANAHIDPASLPAYQAPAKFLMR